MFGKRDEVGGKNEIEVGIDLSDAPFRWARHLPAIVHYRIEVVCQLFNRFHKTSKKNR